MRRFVEALPAQTQPAPPKGKLTPWSLGLLLGGNGIDAGSTVYALNKGATEANPAFGDDPSTTRIVAQKGLTTLAQWLVLKKLAETNPGLANKIAKGLGIGMMGVGVNNLIQARK